jgi:uncharacterized membrane protein
LKEAKPGLLRTKGKRFYQWGFNPTILGRQEMSRQNNSLPRDLLAAALISILALGLTMLPPDLVRFSAPIGIILVIFLPGYAATIAIFPRARDIEIKERLLLSLGLCIAIAVLTALGLGIAGKLDPASMSRSIAIIALFAIAAAFIRWSSLPRGWRFIPNYTQDIGLIGGKKRVGIHRSAAIVLLAVAVIAVISAFAYTNTANTAITAAPGQKDEKGFTEFYVVDDSSTAMTPAGITSSLIVGIVNREHHAADYTLRLALKGSALSEKSIKLNNNKSWEGPVSFIINDPGDMQRLDLLLYKDGDFSKPYEEKHIWINVTESAPQGSPANGGISKPEDHSVSHVVSSGGSHSGGSSGSSLQSGGTGEKATIVQSPQESPVEENNAEVQEAVQETEPPVEVSSPSIAQEPEQNETSPSNNESLSNASEENSSSQAERINISSENLTLNITEGINVVNASDLDQEIGEVKGESGPGIQENNINNSVDANESVNSSLNMSQKSSPSVSKPGGLNISKPESLNVKELNHNITTNISSNSIYNAPQIFYTRPKPGSSNQKEPAAVETAPTLTTNEPDANSDTGGASSNSVYKIQSTANVSARDAGVSRVISESLPTAVQNKSDHSAATANSTQHGINQTANASNGVNTGKSEAHVNQSHNASKDITSKAQPAVPHDEEVVRMQEMDRKIDSWVSTRSMGAKNTSQSYNSDIIQYSGKDNSVVLGGQSQAPMKVG